MLKNILKFKEHNVKRNHSNIDYAFEIQRLKKLKNAVILAHVYQSADIQDLADFVGDSLDLSRKAANTDADTIVFSGVKFMAEVAKILSPNKEVLLPDMDAGCTLEQSCQPEEFKKFKNKHKDHLVITYINCSAEIKALSDIIVTSSNAKKIIDQIPKSQPIIFAPDKHLGAYLNKITNRKMLLWNGTCIVHIQFSERELVGIKAERPNALFIAHPECPEAILKHADHVGSTSSLIQFVSQSKKKEFIIGTEPNVIHQMRKKNPEKIFIEVPGADGNCSCNRCPYMALNTMEKIYLNLKDSKPGIHLSDTLIRGAKKPLQRMLDMTNN